MAVLTEPDLDTIAESVVERIRVDAEFASKVAEQLGIVGGAALRTVAEIIENDEDFSVEFKSTARWDLREDKPSRAMEDAVVKTVAGFVNTDGGTLLIGVGPDRQIVWPRPRLPEGEAPERGWLRQLADDAPEHRSGATPPSCAAGRGSPSTTATRSAASTSPAPPDRCGPRRARRNESSSSG